MLLKGAQFFEKGDYEMGLFDQIEKLRWLEARISYEEDLPDSEKAYVTGLAESKRSAIMHHLSSLGLEPQLQYLEERAFYVLYGIRAVEELLGVMTDENSDILLPEYKEYYHIEDISVTADGLQSVMRTSVNDCTPCMAARLRLLLNTEKWSHLSDIQGREMWELINRFVRCDIDPYRAPVRDALIRKHAHIVELYLPTIESGDGPDRDKAICELGEIGITEADPKVLRYALYPTEAEPPLSESDRLLIAANPDWSKIAGSGYWYNQADETPGETRLSMQHEHVRIMRDNPDWKVIALSVLLAQYNAWNGNH